MAEEIELEEATVLRLQAGDVVCITINDNITSEQVEDIRERVRALLPLGNEIMVLTSGTKLSVLRGVDQFGKTL